FKEYRAADVVKVDILLNGDKVDALSIIVHRSQAPYRSRAVVAKMRELIARQMYDVAIQAAIGSNIIARETIKALRKNVLAKRFLFAPRRLADAENLEQQDVARRRDLARQGIQKIDGDIVEAKRAVLAQPWWLDWTAGLFPVILVVFLLRSFLFEPFKIPSGSMIPTLLVGDLILVNKYHYGVRLPVVNRKIIANHDPQRGDVMVFRYPNDTSIDYIKRVVGLPGDEVAYRNQQLYLNGQPVPADPLPDFFNEETL